VGKILILAFIGVFFLGTTAFSEEIIRIEVGKDYRRYSQSDLQHRVWELERAVWQLQQRVFQLEAAPTHAPAEAWICTISAVGNNYTGTGNSKVAAMEAAIKNCKAGQNGDTFFCKNPTCEK